MRSLLHSSLYIEATRNSNLARLQGFDPLVASGLEKIAMRAIPAGRTRETGIAASAETRQYFPAQSTAGIREPKYPNESYSDADDIDYRNEACELTATAIKPGIVVIYPRAVFRDCFVRCLEISYEDHKIFSFSDISEWRSSKEPSALAAAVIIVGIENGEDSHIADLELLKTVAANIPVVIVSDTDDLNHIVRTLKGGVRGYIPTSLPFNIAVEAVRLVKAGGVFVPASSLVHDRNEQQLSLKNSVLLTERQMMVVEEIRHGKANKQIAYELKMSEHTVKVHLRHIMRKLKARNRTEVAVLSKALFSETKDTRSVGLDVGPAKGFKGI